ncbi:fibronectin type III domain-containing protein [Nocardioides dubius]|uniref:OmpA family protein n=1 Tax=Nocardioides dubius TaxID=317019 RepID=A0ABN1TLL1_9ACTN
MVLLPFSRPSRRGEQQSQAGRRPHVAAALAALLAGSAAVVVSAPSASAASSSCTDGTTPSPLSTVSCVTSGNYTLGVPSGTTDVDVEVVGGGGGAGYPARQHIGGNAAQVTGNLTLPAGTEYLYLIVGAGGGGNNNGLGYGGGGSGIFALDGNHNLIAKLAIAGAGGGGSYNGDGGNAGQAGTSENPGFAGAGAPAIGAVGGSGGVGNYNNGAAGASNNPGAATLAAGGAGGTYPSGSTGGSGGGGYGGGGGGAAGSQGILNVYTGGGGGGSSLASAYLSGAAIAIRPGTGGIQLPALVAGDGAGGSITMTFNGAPPVTVPGAPTGVSAVAGDGEATVSFTAPVEDGGAAITEYTVAASPGDVTKTCAASPCTVTGLTNGTAYTFTVVATNSVGDSVESAPSAAVTPVRPVTVPGAPTGVSAVAGDGEATVSFTAPVEDGGAAITEYTVAASPGDVTKTCAASPCTVTGLTNGTAHTFTVVATNSFGDSVESAPSAAVTPQSAPVVTPTPTPIPVNWFRDPLTRKQRAQLAPVPTRPERAKGPARRTKALHRTANGTLAVPAGKARGHQLAAGQGVQLTGLFRYDSARLTPSGRKKLVRLVGSLRNVRALTCEGHADYAGNDRREQTLSERRARTVCTVLKQKRPKLATKAIGYGQRRPAVIGGTVSQRDLNRRVVVLIRR